MSFGTVLPVLGRTIFSIFLHVIAFKAEVKITCSTFKFFISCRNRVPAVVAFEFLQRV